MKAPEDERDTIDSYTKSLGLKTAPVVVMVLLLLSTASLVILLGIIFKGVMPWYWYALLAGPLLFAVLNLLRFQARPHAQTAKKCEDAVALAMLAGYGLLLAGLFSVRGFVWI